MTDDERKAEEHRFLILQLTQWGDDGGRCPPDGIAWWPSEESGDSFLETQE